MALNAISFLVYIYSFHFQLDIFQCFLMAISSPRRIDDLLETGCLRSILSSLGRNKHAPAPQGPGFPLHEPSVKPHITSLSFFNDYSRFILLSFAS